MPSALRIVVRRNPGRILPVSQVNVHRGLKRSTSRGQVFHSTPVILSVDGRTQLRSIDAVVEVFCVRRANPVNHTFEDVLGSRRCDVKAIEFIARVRVFFATLRKLYDAVCGRIATADLYAERLID